MFTPPPIPPRAPQSPPHPPPSFPTTAPSILHSTALIIAQVHTTHATILNTITPSTATFSNTILPLAHAENARRLKSDILCFYRDVSPDAELRAASNEAQRMLEECDRESWGWMNAQLFELVEAVVRNQKNNNQEEVLDVESARLLERTHRLFLRNGLGLSTEYKRQLFREIGRRLTQLKQVFRENQIKKSGGLWFERKELEGLPEGVLEGLDREQGDADGNGDGDRKGGRLWLTFEYYHLIPTLRYIKMSETRKRCYIGYENKCKPNVAIFNETTVLRDEAARLLGYANHAAFRMEEKMAKTVETVNRFLSELRGKLSDYGTRELERLKALKMADLESKGEKMDGRFYLWDTEFYKNMLVEQEYKVDQQKIAQYFALEQVLPGLFKIFERLFGLRFMKLVDEGEGKGSVWHQDVRIFAVWNSGDEGGDFVGYLYLDLFKREGKLEQPFNVNLQPGFTHKDGTRQHPSTALICSFPQPQPTLPTLLTHPELTTLFHELGHGIHDLVSITQYSHFHGTNTALDFGEAPSLMLEHWCWDFATLKSLSRHVTHGGRIPDDILRNLIRTRYVHSALFHLRTLQLSMFDMMVHQPSTHEEIQGMNTSIAYNKIRREIMQIDGPEVFGEGFEWGHGQGSFGHAMDEYDAGMYSYLYAQVIADDLFDTVFAANPMDPQCGRRYRHDVLQKGGSQDEMATVVDFLGREPCADSFYKNLGLNRYLNDARDQCRELQAALCSMNK